MPVFMSPLALWGMLITLALAAVYLFRRQSREVKVSSLMFFSRIRVPAEGGRRLTTPQMPLILLIELLIVTLLVLAAANPRAISGEKLIPVVLILDDSFSMQVNEPVSPRAAAISYLEKNFFSRDLFRITIVRAGRQPEIIGRHDMAGNEARQLMKDWRCAAATADIHTAVRYVSESLPAGVKIYVVTDMPGEYKHSANLVWLAFGQPLANLAITAANRYVLGNSDRCFFEFTNFASQPARLVADISAPERGVVLDSIDVELSPRSTRRLRITLKDPTAVVRARINNDPFAFDNVAWLLPVRRRPVEVELNFASTYLKKIVQRSVEASGIAEVVASSTELFIGEQPQSNKTGSNLWQYIIHNATQPAMLRGVVAVDKTHPLCLGLPPVKAAWAVDEKFVAMGAPLMSAAGTGLLTVTGAPGQNQLIWLNFSAEFSNLQTTPMWPVMFWNLLNWRQQTNPGPDSFNYRSGTDINVILPPDDDSITLADSLGKVVDGVVWRKKAVFHAADPGVFNIKTGIASWSVAVNLCSSEESDLLKSGSSILPTDQPGNDSMKNFADVRWWFLLPALLLMALHQWLTGRRRHQSVY